MPNKDNSLFATNEGETLATSGDSWRRKKAKDQPRDANGRWIADGARITYKDGLLEKRVAATVVSTDDGKAVVLRDNPDGTTTRQTVPNRTVEVVSSKARIRKDGTVIEAPEDDFGPVLNSKKFKDILSNNGQGTITRPDGYQLDAFVETTPADPKMDKKNPISYQLFAPGGKSLGTYSKKAAPSFNEMIEDDKGAEDTSPEPAAAEEGRMFGMQPVRVARDRSFAIFKDEEGIYKLANLSSLAIERKDVSLAVLMEGQSWRKPLRGELSVEALRDLSADTITASAPKAKPYRVPEKVKTAITASLASSTFGSESDRNIAEAIASSDSVSIDEVKWISEYVQKTEESKALAGGPNGEKWASKILEGFSDNNKHDFASDKFSYFATGDGQNGWKVSDIIAVDFSTDEVYNWGPDGFTLSELTVEHVDEPILLPIDEFAAESLTSWIDSGREGEVFSLADIDPLERNLVELALSELDLDELDSIGAIVAAGESVVDVDGYTPAERSANAKNQPRANGGKFGQKRTSDAPLADEEPEIKARLEEELPLVENPSQRITEWLEAAPITAAGEPVEETPTEAPITEEAPAETPTEEAPTEDAGESKSLYFAVVDDVDRTAVLDVVAITKNDLHESEAWKRSGSDWVPAPEYLSKFMGATPPPVVELEVPEPAKTVLAQVDTYDEERGNGSVSEETPATTEEAPAAEQTPVVASSGFTLSNGRWAVFNAQDLENAVSVLELSKMEDKNELKSHLRKRAFALNRMDLIPSEWRTATLAERGEQFMKTSALYGEFGEVIVAAGVPGIADTPSDWAAAKRLQNYWTRGKGALKIRWGTPGDLTRAHRHLAKYVGPQRAWGLAQKYHKSIFGVYNHTHDVATGQYKPRRRKRR